MGVVLTFLKKLSPLKDIGLRDLTLKLAMLMSTTTAQRAQTLHKLNWNNMTMQEDSVIFYVNELLKQSKPGNVGARLEFKKYLPDVQICVYTVLRHYINVTKELRGKETQLLISYRKPHTKISKDTISNWIKRTLRLAGVNVEIFKSHSTRAASSSAADKRHVPVPDILSAAGWSNEKTFQSYYNKPLAKESSFANAVLQV